jgi:hypothetical protein
MTDRLDVALLHRHFEPRKQELYSVDFLVNGVSLLSATKAEQRDLTGCFMSLTVDGENERLAKVFTGELVADQFPEDRIPLFVCPYCGDAGCGAITFKLTRHGKLVRWSHFAYENTWDDQVTDFESYSTLGPFEFDLASYKLTIQRAVTMVST